MTFPQEVLENLLKKTLLYVMVINRKGQVLQVNNRAESLFTLPKDEIIRSSIFSMLLDEDEKLLRKNLNLLSSENQVINQKIRFARFIHEGILTLKTDLIYNDRLVYVCGIDITEENDEHNILQAVSKLTKTGAWHYNVITEKMFFSKECYRLHELEVDTPINMEEAINYYHPNSRKKVKDNLEELLQNHIPIDFVECLVTAKGNERWVHVLGEPVIDDNKVIFINGSFSDITERHQYIEKLKYSEETKYLALKGIKSGLFDHHIKEKVVYIGKDFRKMLGLPLDIDFLPDESFKKMIHPNDLEEAIQRHRNNLKKSNFHYFNHYRLKLKDGSFKHYEVHGYRKKNKEGETVRMIGNLIDVHQKKINEKAIIDGKNKLKAIVNNGFAYTVLLDTDGKIVMCDDATSKIIKRDFNIDVMKIPSLFVDVTPLNLKNKFVFEFNEALKGKETKKEIERINRKGSSQWLETKYTPIFGVDHTVDSVLVSFHDITEQKNAELSIKEAHQKERELNFLKSNILSNFSHEIRTPLNGIITISKLLIQEENAEERQKLISYLNESNTRLLETIDSLSRLSDIDSVQQNLNYQKVDINYVVETSFREFRHVAKTKKLNYDIILDETSPEVNIDEKFLKPALDNIIHNAIKYTEKGSVTISIYTKSAKNNVYIAIKDTGIGINKSNLAKIFDPFMQESVGLSRKYEGTGIGLSLSKRYIEVLGGKIKVKSELNKGTEFIIIIPKLI